MKKTTQIAEFAAAAALGALDPEDARALAVLLAEEPGARRETGAFAAVAEALAQSLPARRPPLHLREVILRRVAEAQARAIATKRLKSLIPPSQDGLAFLRDVSSSGWVSLSVPGASVKLLSFDDSTGYAVVLGKLEPGSRYPAHPHQSAEDLFMLSGDLHIGEHVIQAGDFHHAEAGSSHGVNWSENGCTLLAVLSKDDLLTQLLRR
ncbi:MAG: cupin domain-containing protein [Verrucomicrobiota bacterium]